MKNVTFTIETETETITADFATTAPSDLNIITRGETATFDLYIPENAGSTVVPDTILKYDRYAGEYTTINSTGNVYYFREFLPSGIDVNSLVVGISPSSDLDNDEINGIWGLINNVTDNRNQALTNPIVTLEVEILAKYSDYASVSAVQSGLRV